MPFSYSPKSLSDWIKPSRNEAIARLRTNAIALVALFIVTHLAPLPSLWTAFHVVSTRAEVGPIWWALCVIETLMLAVLGTNIVQCSYALQYPSTKIRPPPSTPTKFMPQSPASKTPRRLGITPTSTPQPQRTFNASYITSPISTPSRTLNYTIPPSAGSPFDTSLDTSTSSLPGSPNPILSSPLAAYRGKHSSNIGRAFDGDLLSRLTRHDDDDDED